MTTFTFAGSAGAYVIPEFTPLEIVGDGGLLLDGAGRLHAPTDESVKALRYTGEVGAILSSTVVLAAAGNSEGVYFGPAVIDDEGNGYSAQLNGGVVTLARLIALSQDGSELNSDSIVMDASGALTLTLNTATGDLTVLYEDSPQFTANDTTYAAGLKEAVAWYSWTGTAQGITAFIVPDAPPSGPAVNPTGTDVALVNGGSYEIQMQAMDGATATALTIRYTDGELVVNSVQAAFDYTAADADTGTLSFTATKGHLPYGATGFQYIITLSVGDPVVSALTSLAPAAGYSYVVAVNPVSDDTGLFYQWASGGAVSGDQADWQEEQSGFTLGVNSDFTFQATSETFPTTASIVAGYWDSVTGIRYVVTVNVRFSEGGGGSVISGAVLVATTLTGEVLTGEIL